MSNYDHESLDQLAGLIAQKLGMQQRVTACDGSEIGGECTNVLYSSFTIEDFLRSGQTDIDVIKAGSGVIPVVPGQSVTLEQGPHPGWSAGCINISYRLANNGTNHGDIRFDFFVDNVPLDRPLFGSNIYDNANNLINDGLFPLPLQGRRQCCIGALNKLAVKITHQGANNQLEQPRIFVLHAKRECCSACASGKSCQPGCSGEKPSRGSFSGQLGMNLVFNNNPPPPATPLALPPTPPAGSVLVLGKDNQWYAVPQRAIPVG